MNNGSSLSFTSNLKDISELDQFARQISTFLFPKRRFAARSRVGESKLSATLWKENDHYFLLYLTKDAMRADQIGQVLDVLAVAVDQIGLSLEQVKSRITLSLIAQDFEMLFLERIQFVMPKIETHSWLASTVEQREFIMLKEAKSPLKPEKNTKTAANNFNYQAPFLSDDLTSEELAELARLGSDLRKIQ